MQPAAYQVSKTFTHELGLSCAFRQANANSHCRFLHGYALEVQLVFEATTLDVRHWVLDFGGLREVREYLLDTFDHKLLVAQDDPALPWVWDGWTAGYLDVVVVPATGCEAFATQIAHWVHDWLQTTATAKSSTCRLVSVEVREHGGNGAKVLV